MKKILKYLYRLEIFQDKKNILKCKVDTALQGALRAIVLKILGISLRKINKRVRIKVHTEENHTIKIYFINSYIPSQKKY